ncbi:MAG: NAD(+) diphosphatase [Rhodospirillales bacterium]|nr:MAG: NAD(+) diphosphatase [Rhodospirillales bacterium]
MKPPNIYAAGGIDRAAHLRGDADWVAGRLGDPATRIVPVWRSRNLVDMNGAPAPHLLPPERALIEEAQAVALLGLVDGVAHFAIDLSHRAEPETAVIGRFEDLRSVGPLLAHGDGALLAYARGMMHWHLAHRFCGRCGHATESGDAGHVRHCADAGCAAPVFPRTDPAVIMLIHHGDRALLGRQRIWPQGMHSVLAGFVEPGESLEDAVAREVFEEAGIEIDEIRYHSSQPWPFPSSIMLGFYGRARTDALAINTDELESGRWYGRDELRNSPEDESFRLPRRDSISYRLIRDWLDGAG